MILVSALPAALHMAKEYGPTVRRLIAERLGFGWGRGELASVPVEVEPDAVELHDLREPQSGISETDMLGKWLLMSLGVLAMAVGLIGVVVPLLPTTPFLLLAAACFVRSSDYDVRLAHLQPVVRRLHPGLS